MLDKKNLIQTLQHLMPDVRLIYLFGSQADGSATPSSDIDVAVLLKKKLDPVARFDIEQTVANILNKQHDTGIPQSSRDSFELLKKAGLISAPMALSLQKMVGLRNVAVHDYQALNLEIVKHVVEHRLAEFEEFVDSVKSMNN